MSVAHRAGPRAVHPRAATLSPEVVNTLSCVAPPGRGTVGPVDEWMGLLARMSHDLRTPLNAVIGFSDAMQQELFGPIGNARYEEYVRHIRASGMELLEAAELALSMTALLARGRVAVAEDVALAPIIIGTIEDLTRRDRGGVVAVSAVADDVLVRSDPELLARAVRQLVTIALSRAATQARVEVAAASNYGLVELSVRVSELGADSALLVEGSATAVHDLALGRRDMGVWLAVALLDMLDCRLTISIDRPGAILRTTLEEARQRDFFSKDT
jgi:hypothetical protein